MSTFTDPAAVAHYANAALRKVPGLHDLHKMAHLLLSEAAGPDAHILVLGAGGGMELSAFAEAQPGWTFTGVDPSAEMLALAARTLGPLAPRATLVQGYIDTAPPGPFDGATCFLTLHFLSPEVRLQTLRDLHRRLRPGARLVVAHHAMPEGEKIQWLTRSAAFAIANGEDAAQARASIPAMAARLPTLSPEDETNLLAAAGFAEIQLFYAAFSFRGWVATA